MRRKKKKKEDLKKLTDAELVSMLNEAESLRCKLNVELENAISEKEQLIEELKNRNYEFKML